MTSEVSFDLRGHLEAIMASEATKMAVRGNTHMDTSNVILTHIVDLFFERLLVTGSLTAVAQG